MNHLAEDVIESIWFVTRQDRDMIDDRFVMKMVEWTSHTLCDICSRQEQEEFVATVESMRAAIKASQDSERIKFMDDWITEGLWQSDSGTSDRISDIDNINLADLVTSHLLELLLNAEERYFDPELTREEIDRLSARFADVYSPAERHALTQSAHKELAYYLQEPDENGFTPRRLLQPDKKEILDSLIGGRFLFYLRPRAEVESS